MKQSLALLGVIFHLFVLAPQAGATGAEGHALLRQPAADSTLYKVRPEWNFTAKDYAALRDRGGELRFSERSQWFPAELRQSLLGVLQFVLDERLEPSSTAGINRMDFYHGHLICTAKGYGLQEISQKIYSDRESTFALAGLKWFEKPTKKNYRVWARITDKLDRSSGLLVGDAIASGLCDNALIQFHTFEYNNTDHGVGLHSFRRHLSMRLGDPQNQVVRKDEEPPKDPLDELNLSLRPLLSLSDEPAQPREPETTMMFNFGFLIDRSGVIHMTEGSELGLHRFTGVSD